MKRVPQGELFGDASGAAATYDAWFGASPADEAFSLTLNGLAERWLGSPKFEGYTENSRNIHRKSLREVRDVWGNHELSHFNDPRFYSHALAWQATLTHKKATADNLINTLSSLLKFGKMEGLLDENYASGIPDLYKVGRRAKFIFTRSKVERFVEAAVQLGMPHVGDAVRLGFETGMRPQDLRTALERNVRIHDFSKWALKRSPHGNRYPLTIPLTSDLLDVIDSCKMRYRADGIENLLVKPDGEPWEDFQLENAFRLVRDRAGICFIDPDTGMREELHLHDLRGTYVTRLVMTTSLGNKEIADRMGWSAAWVRFIRRVYTDDTTRIRSIGKMLASLKF